MRLEYQVNLTITNHHVVKTAGTPTPDKDIHHNSYNPRDAMVAIATWFLLIVYYYAVVAVAPLGEPSSLPSSGLVVVRDEHYFHLIH